MLRKIRIALASVFFIGITLLFLDFTGTLHAWLGWMARVQFLPAVMALNLGVIIFLVALTLLFGRVYCSVICPLGVMQDIISWFSGRRKGKKARFRYSPARNWWRYTVLALFIAAIAAGIGSFVALLAPYSSYGRIVQNLLSPIYILGNNLLAYIAERVDSYAFYSKDIWIRSLPTFGVALITFTALFILAWKNGRTYCNTICPVGTMLGLLSRFSLFRPAIDTRKCNGCTLCSRKCKASCIDAVNHKIDYSRCVACMDCLDNCSQHAISYTWRRNAVKDICPADAPDKKADSTVKPSPEPQDAPDQSRRSFLAGVGLAVGIGAVQAQKMKLDGGLAVITEKKVPKRKTKIVPPGALSIANLERHCTGCQLCVSACPNDVLRPSTDLESLMQPESSYERGYCRPECTRCSEVCPAGAIRLIDTAQKCSTQIGHAVWVRENCLPLTDGVECGNCARHCPAWAIQMVPSDPDNEESPKIPVVNTERCIGCGACENLCPSRPFSAIYVEGHETHRTI